MCLYTVVDAKPSVAEHDIEVYKVVIVSEHIGSTGNGVAGRFYRSPYMGHYYDIGETYKSGLSSHKNMLDRHSNFGVKAAELLTIADDCDYIGVIELGLHSFASLDEAKGFCGIREKWNEYAVMKYVVLRCVIPAGSKFYSGIWVHSGNEHSLVYVDSYASSALKVIQEITESV